MRGLTPSTITTRPKAGMSRSPDFQLHYGIELQDYFFEITSKGLLCRASLEPDEPLSWHPALRVVDLDGW